MNTKLLVGGIICTLIGTGTISLWWYGFQRRETEPFRRVAKYNILWGALLLLVMGLGFIIVAIFGE